MSAADHQPVQIELTPAQRADAERQPLMTREEAWAMGVRVREAIEADRLIPIPSYNWQDK